MATPGVRKSNNRHQSGGQRIFKSLPLVTRRCAAWAVEMTLVLASGLIPFSIGAYTNATAESDRVPLNPVLAATEATIARALALPTSYKNRNVAPLTNLFWSAALVAPLVLSGWQFYLLSKTGSTTPKRWFGVRVVTGNLTPPSWQQVLVREAVGRWGVPLSLAYFIWRYTGAFPNLGILSGLALLMLLGENLVDLVAQERRTLHDRIAGTYVIDALRPYKQYRSSRNGSAQSVQDVPEQFNEAEENAAIASVVITPDPKRQKTLWVWMRQNPAMTLLLVGLFSLAAVLGTLVATQVYIQNQANRRESQQRNSEQFLALVKQLEASSGANLEERRAAILALGTLNETQAYQFLVQLLGQQNDKTLLDAIQQALTSAGSKAIPYLQQLNQSLANELQGVTYNSTPTERQLRLQRLQASQKVIAKILSVNSGKNYNVDLSRINLSQNLNQDKPPFILVLDKVDLSGINFKGANLNNGSFRGGSFRGIGEDGRSDTYDDWIADLSNARMQQTNLTEANLSRVIMNNTDLSRATLNRANLTSAHLTGANLISSRLVGADLRNAVLEGAKLTSADLGEANFQKANLFSARLNRVIALGTKLTFSNLIRTDWQGADLSGADLSNANLHSANLSASRLTDTNFRNAQLENANLRNADLTLADFRGANVASADFQGAIFITYSQEQPDQFIQTPTTISQSARVEGVDFSSAKNLDTKQLAYICSQGGRHPRCP